MTGKTLPNRVVRAHLYTKLFVALQLRPQLESTFWRQAECANECPFGYFEVPRREWRYVSAAIVRDVPDADCAVWQQVNK
jgi:hypothetical protein